MSFPLINLFEIVAYRHEDKTEVKHDGKRPWEAKVDSVESLEILDKDKDKSDNKKTDAELGFGFFVHWYTSFTKRMESVRKKALLFIDVQTIEKQVRNSR